jgi:2-keto-3-deoxygluconate permease
MQIKKAIDSVPGGLMIIPLFLGVLTNTFFPEALKIGGFTTAMFSSSGALPILGVFLVCVGSQLSFDLAPKALKKGVILTTAKYAIGVAIGLGVGKFLADGSLLGLTPLAIIAAMTNSNGGMYSALSGEYGDQTDVGAVSVLSLNDGPFFTMIALGASGFAAIPWMAFVAVAFPICLGMVLGNLDPEMRKFLGQGEKLMILFFSFPLGAGMDLHNVVKAGGAGVLLGVMTVVLTGFGGYFALKLFRERPLCGMAEGSTAGNAVGTPLAIAAVDPTLQSLVPTATAQVAAACITTAILCPVLVVMWNKYLTAKGSPYAKQPKPPSESTLAPTPPD